MPLERSRQKYTGYNLKTVELLDCALIGICAVIRSNMVCSLYHCYCSCFRRAPLATFHDVKHTVSYIFLEETKKRLLTVGKDKVVKVTFFIPLFIMFKASQINKQ